MFKSMEALKEVNVGWQPSPSLPTKPLRRDFPTLANQTAAQKRQLQGAQMKAKLPLSWFRRTVSHRMRARMMGV